MVHVLSACVVFLCTPKAMVLDAPHSLQVVSLEDAKVSKKDRVVVRSLFLTRLVALSLPPRGRPLDRVGDRGASACCHFYPARAAT